MDLKKLLGDKYKEGMTLDEVNEVLADIEVVNKSELPDMSKYVKKELFDKSASETAKYKRQYRATLDEAEQEKIKQQEEHEATLKELATLKEQVKTGEYEAKFLSLGYDSKSAKEAAKALFAGDMDTIFSIQAKNIENIRKEVSKQQLQDTPTPPTGKGTPVTKNPNEMSLAELQEMLDNSPEQFEQMTS